MSDTSTKPMTPAEVEALIARLRQLGYGQYELRCEAAAALAAQAQRIAEVEGEAKLWRSQYAKADAACNEAEAALRQAQAKIDALMLEYCPDEMTPEQLAEWGEHQVAAPAAAPGEKP